MIVGEYYHQKRENNVNLKLGGYSMQSRVLHSEQLQRTKAEQGVYSHQYRTSLQNNVLQRTKTSCSLSCTIFNNKEICVLTQYRTRLRTTYSEQLSLFATIRIFVTNCSERVHFIFHFNELFVFAMKNSTVHSVFTLQFR